MPVEAAECVQGPASVITAAVSRLHCRQNHGKPDHSGMGSWYGSPSPSHASNHKLMAMEPGKSLSPGESPALAGVPRGGPGRAGALLPLRPGPALRQGLCFSFTATGDPKEEGLEAQISRLAELIGRLENKVRPSPASA